MKNIIKITDLLNLLVILISGALSVYILYINENKHYNLLFIFPIAFSILYVTAFSKILKKNANPYNITFCILLFIRYEIMSCLVAKTGVSCGAVTLIDDSSYFIAQILMLIEIIMINILILFNEKKKQANNKVVKNTVYISSNNRHFIILAFFLLVLALVFIFKNRVSRMYIFHCT